MTEAKNNPVFEDFHILSLSGGGYKGLYTATIIEQFEKRTGKLFGSHFDLICGTSIGGIIALALATREIPALEITEKLREAGPKIFTPIAPPGRWALKDRKVYELTGLRLNRGISAAKHSNTVLKETLERIFGNRKIKDLKTRVLIPTANWTKGAPQFFKTPHKETFITDKEHSLVDISMATSAAPIYLPNYEFEEMVYVDGGIFGNAPGIFGVHEAEHSIPDAKDKNHLLLSIGTLSAKRTADQSKSLDKGLADWKTGLFDYTMACQEQVADFMLKQKMNDRYYMIDRPESKDQSEVIALDKADEAATSTLMGMARVTFQDEVVKPEVTRHLNHQAPDLNFK